MKALRHLRRRFRRERGQTLILGVMAMVIILVGILVLFDVQRVIRGKVKVMSAIDSAALTGARWQQNTLNLIGEMNLVKACTVLITEPAYQIGGDPGSFLGNAENDDRERLRTSADMLTQMQIRVAFVGPLIGFGAAQQAAKNNGLTYNESCNTFLNEMLNDINSEEYYGNPDIVSQEYYGFRWREPYANMVAEILGGSGGESKGVAVGTNVDYLGMPKLIADKSEKPPVTVVNYLRNRTVMEAIAADDWCTLRALLPNDDGIYYQEKWWGNIRLERSTKSLEGSEILPVHITAYRGEDIYTRADEKGMLDEVIKRVPGREDELKRLGTVYDRYDKGDKNDTDGKNNPLPEISWATFDNDWCSYSEYGVDKSGWENYLRGPFQEGVDYRSGALSYFSIRVPDETILKQFQFKRKFAKDHPFRFGGAQSGMGRKINQYGAETEQALDYFDDDSYYITFDATAKPLGYLKTEEGAIRYPFVAGMVLPVFDKVTLIPVSLEPVYGVPMDDRAWIIYITKYLPALGTVNNIDDVQGILDPADFALCLRYHNLIKKLDNLSWRLQGRAWLNAEATGHDTYDPFGNVTGHVTDTINEDHCDDWGGGGGGGRYGPGKLH